MQNHPWHPMAILVHFVHFVHFVAAHPRKETHVTGTGVQGNNSLVVGSESAGTAMEQLLA